MDKAYFVARTGLAAGVPDHLRDSYLERLDKRYNGRQCEYGAWKSTMGEPLKGTLFWEYGKRLCLDAGVYNPAVVVVMANNAASLFEMMHKLVA